MNARSRIATSCMLGVLACRAAAAQPSLIGTEFQVNVLTQWQQTDPAVARDDDGDFVVTWSSQPQPGAGQNVFFQRFSANGSRRGNAFQVTYPIGDGSAVAMDGSDAFIVAWKTYDFVERKSQVIARRFRGNGSTAGGPFAVSTPGQLLGPSVAAAVDGDFVVAWGRDVGLDRRVYARVFDGTGTAKGPEFQVNSSTEGSRFDITAAMDGEGDFVVAWSDGVARDGEASGIFARRFDDDGQPQAPEFQVNTFTAYHQTQPAAAMAANGDFVIVWFSLHDSGYGFHIFGQRFGSSGEALATQFQIDAATEYPPVTPAIAMDARGDFIVTWLAIRYNVDLPRGVFARRFDRQGTPQGGEFQVDRHTSSHQGPPAVAMDASGRAIVVWQADLDGSGAGIFGRRMSDVIAFDLDGNGDFGALTDALMLLRHGFGFRGDPLISGALDEADCARCSAAEVEAFVAELGAAIDVDGNGQVDALTDGVLTLRWAFGLRGAALVNDAVGGGCTHCNSADIEAYLAVWAD